MTCWSRLIVTWMTAAAACAGAEMSSQEISAIDLTDAREDQGWVAPVSPGLAHLTTDPARAAQLEVLVAKLALWAPAHDVDPATRVGALLNAAALVDLGRGACEGEFAWTVIDRLQRDPERAAVLQATAQIAAGRDHYAPVNCLPSLEITTTETIERVHARMALFARKVLGRLLGSLPSGSRQ